MEKNNKDLLKELQNAGATEVTIKFEKKSKGEEDLITDSNDLISSTVSTDQEQEQLYKDNNKDNSYPWKVNFLEALKYNYNPEDECYDSKQHIDDESAEKLTKTLEKKIIRKSKCEPIYEALTCLTNYLYDTYDYNYTTNYEEKDPQGNYVFNIVKNIIDEINEEYLKINLEEAKQIIEAISEKFGDKYKVDDSIFLNIISKVACSSNGKDIMEVIIQFMNKFECISTPSNLKELVDKIEVIVKKYGDTSVLKWIVLAIEENDISKDILIKKIFGAILALKKDEYERLKNQKVLKNDVNIFEISAEDLQTLIINYKTKKSANKKVDDITSKHRKRRSLKNSPKDIGEKRKFTTNPITLIGIAGVMAAALLSVVGITIVMSNNSRTSNNVALINSTEFETDDEELEEDILEELPEVLQENNKKYYIVEYKDPFSKEKIMGYLQLNRDENKIPAKDNVIITKDRVIENVDKYEITPVLTEMRLNKNSGIIDVTDGIEIEDGSYINVLLYNSQDAEEGEYFSYFYDDGEKIYTNTISEKKLKKMVETDDLIYDYNDGKNIIPLSTYIPDFYTTTGEVIISEEEANIIQSGEILLGNREIIENGERINVIGISHGQDENQLKVFASTIEGEDNFEKIESSMDKYQIDKSSEKFTELRRVGKYTLDEKMYVYSSEDTNGIPKYSFTEGVNITLYEYVKDKYYYDEDKKGYIVEDENGHTGAISKENGDIIKDYIELENDQENSLDDEDEYEYVESEEQENIDRESTDDEAETDDEYVESEEENENTDDTELSSFDAFEEEWDGDEIDY